MKRIFLRLSFMSILEQLFFIFLLIMTIKYGVVSSTIKLISECKDGNFDGHLILKTIIYYSGMLLFAYYLIIFYIGNITLNSTCIYVKNDLHTYGYRRKERLQYNASIKYSNIKSIEIISLRTDSRKKKVLVSGKIPYLVIENKNGRHVYFGLHRMTKRCVKSLLIELIKRIKETNKDFKADINKLLDDFSKSAPFLN